MRDFNDADVRRFFHENLAFDDVRPSRYDELMKRALSVTLTHAIEEALDDTFGQNVSDAYTKLDELQGLAYRLANVLVEDDVYKQIRKRIKDNEPDV